jgi:basic amino acid/polyamine antiporter, APA family
VVNLGLGDLQPAAEVYVGLLASTILLVATNAGLIGLSRLSYSMGQYRQLPERLRQLHPRFRTPYVAILTFGGVACLTMLPGKAEFLATVYAFGAMLGFTVAHASVVALRIKAPDRERPYRAPLNVTLRGRSIPLASVLGGLGTGVAFLVVTVLNVETLVAGTIWLTLGMTIYVAYRRRLGLTLTETRKIVLPKPIVEHEVEYESVLVVFDEGTSALDGATEAALMASLNQLRRDRTVIMVAHRIATVQDADRMIRE